LKLCTLTFLTTHAPLKSPWSVVVTVARRGARSLKPWSPSDLASNKLHGETMINFDANELRILSEISADELRILSKISRDELRILEAVNDVAFIEEERTVITNDNKGDG